MTSPAPARPPPVATRVPVTFAAVLIARVVIGGALGLAFTYGIGHLFGTAIG